MSLSFIKNASNFSDEPEQMCKLKHIPWQWFDLYECFLNNNVTFISSFTKCCILKFLSVISVE